MPAEVVSHYRILDLLGSGGMGVVYRAEDTTLRRTVALKLLTEHRTPSDLAVNEPLLREARMASALNHPNICTIYEVGKDSGEVFIAMEYVEGRPLCELIKAAPLPLETLLRYGCQLASALAHAHDRGIIHGDFKPLNIVVTPQGNTKILDFGLARRSDRAEFDKQTLRTLSAENVPTLGGTLPYMAPEQIDGSPASPLTDVWSLGVVLYEMSAGTRPFYGDNLYRLGDSILRDPPKPLPPRVPAQLAAVIFRCLEKEPGLRYQRAGETRAALEALISSPNSIVLPVRPRLRRWLPTALTVMLLASLIGAGVFVLEKFRKHNAVVAVPDRVVLVLPPVPNGDASQSAFESGLADTLNSRLSELSAHHPLAVIPMSVTLAKHVASVDAARQQLGVNLVLVLSVQRAGDQARVNYALVDARSRQQVRSGTITAAAGDPFALQDRVFGSVAAAMEIQLAPQERQPSTPYGTTQPAAYDFYIQGRGYLQNYVLPENVEDAITLFHRALEKDPAYAAAQAGLGEAYFRKYQLTHAEHWARAAIENCQNAAEREPGIPEAHSCLGWVFDAQGDYERAAEQYRRMVEIEPTSDDAYGGLAAAYERLGRLADAEQLYKQAISLRPGYWATYNWLGLFYMGHARYEDATSMFSQVVSLAPDSFTGYYNLGAVRILQGQYANAIPLLQKSLEIRPTGDARSNLGTAYFQMRRYADSASNFEEAVKLDPQNFIFWGNLGDAYYWAPGRRSEAAAAYATAIRLGEEKLRLNPKDARLRSSLAMYHAMRGERKPALDNLDASLRLLPTSPDLLFNAAITYQQLGDSQRALNALAKAVSLGFSPELLRDTPNFDTLRDNPSFVGLIKAHQEK